MPMAGVTQRAPGGWPPTARRAGEPPYLLALSHFLFWKKVL